MAAAAILKKNRKIASLTGRHHPTLFCLIELQYYQGKLESVSFSCQSYRSKTTNVKILAANSMHIYAVKLQNLLFCWGGF